MFDVEVEKGEPIEEGHCPLGRPAEEAHSSHCRERQLPCRWERERPVEEVNSGGANAIHTWNFNIDEATRGFRGRQPVQEKS